MFSDTSHHSELSGSRSGSLSESRFFLVEVWGCLVRGWKTRGNGHNKIIVKSNPSHHNTLRYRACLLYETIGSCREGHFAETISVWVRDHHCQNTVWVTSLELFVMHLTNIQRTAWTCYCTMKLINLLLLTTLMTCVVFLFLFIFIFIFIRL